MAKEIEAVAEVALVKVSGGVRQGGGNRKGKKFTPEHRRKQSESITKWWAERKSQEKLLTT